MKGAERAGADAARVASGLRHRSTLHPVLRRGADERGRCVRHRPHRSAEYARRAARVGLALVIAGSARSGARVLAVRLLVFPCDAVRQSIQ